MLDQVKLRATAGMKFVDVGGGILAPDRAEEAIAFFDDVRRVEPVLYLGEDTWLITRHEDARAILRDTRFSSNESSEHRDGEEPTGEGYARSMLFMDPPNHTRLRGLVQPAFVPRRLKRLEGDIEHAVDDLLDAVVDNGRLDVIADFARPLPVWAISIMLDIPEPDRDRIQELAQDSSLTLDLEYLDNAGAERALSASVLLQDYFRDFVEARREEPGDDVLSGMIAAEESGEALSNEEIVVMADLLFVADHETTVNLIGNGTRTMLDHPGSLERLAAEPELIPSAVEESLRFSPSVTLNGRTAAEDLAVGDKTVKRGQHVIIPTDAVNRDPEKFTDPHTFDVACKDNAHLTFSIGPHVCLGAFLARMEARIAWEKILGRVTEIASLGPSQYREHVTLRGLEAVDISFLAAA
ncbi:MAG: cytochrome P450 [Rhodospirillaceae bacterium]|jgi:pimeloyl-[acyl-carrier protein] synthase|nr:cytochrome P450 [Rhodospirillaceae bacterium]MBT6512496.1 cytochrome P450 [Rhodospirillaceae bacterium]MBT7612029.1 cytochrome P450 [Rhodospirillaceae bacterium]